MDYGHQRWNRIVWIYNDDDALDDGRRRII